MKITVHALIRYMERVLEFDFTELKIHYAIEHGLPSSRFDTEIPDFIRWVHSNICLGDFKSSLHNLVQQHTDERLFNRLHKSKNANDIIEIEGRKYVLHGDSLVTILT